MLEYIDGKMSIHEMRSLTKPRLVGNNHGGPLLKHPFCVLSLYCVVDNKHTSVKPFWLLLLAVQLPLLSASKFQTHYVLENLMLKHTPIVSRRCTALLTINIIPLHHFGIYCSSFAHFSPFHTDRHTLQAHSRFAALR